MCVRYVLYVRSRCVSRSFARRSSAEINDSLLQMLEAPPPPLPGGLVVSVDWLSCWEAGATTPARRRRDSSEG